MDGVRTYLDPYAAREGETYTLDSFHPSMKEDVVNKLARKSLTLKREGNTYIIVKKV